MKRRYFIAGNWKMNAGPAETKKIIEGMKAELSTLPAAVDTVFCPPYISLPAISQYADYVSFGAQDVHFEDNGAFTGAISTSMLNELKAGYCIIGHSERREFFGETDQTVNKKAIKLLAAAITPIICCGETLDQRKNIDFEAFVGGQVKAAFAGISAANAVKCVVAYEPIWAIGTGETASPEQAQSIHKSLRTMLTSIYGSETAQQIRILYGGSMKAANAAELLSQEDVDGGLVGGASLKPAEFAAIIRAAQKLS
jgi:triosephosphate isomerase